MRNFLLLIIGIVILLAAALFVVPGLIPSEVYQEKIETQLSKELGRDVIIGGDVELKSFPFIRARTSNVSVKNYAGFTDQNFIKIQALEAKIKLLPLLSKRVEITGFNLNKPEIFLERKANGKTNWSDPRTNLPKDQNQSDSQAAPFQRDGRYTHFDPQIASFTLAQGRIKYTDAVEGQNIELNNISGSLSLPSLSSPLRIDTKLQYQDTPMEIDLQLDNVRAFLNGRVVPFTTRIISEFADIDIEGQFSHSEDLDFTAKLRSSFTDFGVIQTLTPQTIPYFELLQTLKLEGDITYLDKVITVQEASLDVSGQEFSANYKGLASYSDNIISADGYVITTVNDIDKLAKTAKFESPYTALLSRLMANGDITVHNKTIKLANLDTTLSDGIINGRYLGQLGFNNTVTLDGEFNLKSDNISEINNLITLETPYLSSLKTITLQGKARTDKDDIFFSGLSASSTKGLVSITYQGDAQYSPKTSALFTLNGDLSADITSIRELAKLGGSDLPQSSEAGEIFGQARFAGKLKGSSRNLALSKASLVFDQIKGSGSINASFKNPTPFITTDVTLEGFDLRPYMANYSAQNPTGDIQPWSKETINATPLKLVDGVFNISTPNIVTDRLSLGQSNITAHLTNGRLKADLPNLSLYGGSGHANILLDASKTIPEFTLDLTIDKVEGNSFLGAVSGLTKVTGTADTTLSIEGIGKTQFEMMKSLSGTGQFGLSGGEIKGIDVVKFTTGLDEAFKTKALPQGIGAEQTTEFRALRSLFAIKNGVVTINEFNMSATGLAAKGAGQIDLGNQTIDFKLRPRLTSENAGNIAAYGIPLQFSGGFGSAKAGLDNQFLGDIIKARAKAEAAKHVQGQVKGPLGDILGSVIGGNTPSKAPSPNGDAKPVKPEDEIKNVLGGLLGQSINRGKQNDTQENQTTTDPKESEKEADAEKDDSKKSDLEKALGSLFDN